VLRRDARRRIALPQVSGLVDRQPGAGQVTRVIRQAARGQRRELFPQVLPAPHIPAEQRLHPVRPLMPGLLRDLPRVGPHIPRQREHVVERRRDAPRLPHYPAEHQPDQRIGSLPALCRISYACHRGRGIVFCFRHKLQKASHGRPRYTPHERHAPSRQIRPADHERSTAHALTVKPQL
jgi:hypothetical protein